MARISSLLKYPFFIFSIASFTQFNTDSELSSHIIEFFSLYQKSLPPFDFVDITGNPHNKYSDDDLLCKFGCTDDLPRRTYEHDKLFNKEFNVKIELICFSIIESKYIFNAESNINQYLLYKMNLLDTKSNEEFLNKYFKFHV